MSTTDSRRSSHQRVDTDRPQVEIPPYNADTTVAIYGVVQAVVASESTNLNQPTGEQQDERSLENGQRVSETDSFKEETFIRAVVWAGLTVLCILGLVFMLFFVDRIGHPEWASRWTGRLPKDPMLAALQVMDNSPVIVRLVYLTVIKL